MTTHDNRAIETPEWAPEPRCCPFPKCSVCETKIQAHWRHGEEAHIIRGTE